MFQGIGKSLALRLSQLGANVIALSKSDEHLKQLVEQVIDDMIVLFVFDLNTFDCQ
jgi:NAD(P)-dependent dehydrogenase (short-subunit alcohol dehydrogenase family)